uniref:Si:ch211-284e13.6 n=1 Tax=Cyprinus carpio carpio TaxID=630221 RepID=A0A9J7YDZ1_CYPCA
MEDRRHLPPDGGGNAKRSASAECDTEDRVVRKEQGDPETSTQMRVRKDDLCDVPRKVPRFQYVDFPSLHQCIQQLSVPPLNGWLGSCSLTKAPDYRPTSPKEKVPKFKYVDYPSLHHCIQQLSVPPLESWSAGLVRFNAEGKQDDSGTVKNNLRNEARDQNNENRNRVTAFSFPRDTHTLVSGKEEVPQRLEKGKPEAALQSDCGSRSESGSGSDGDAALGRNNRPSVINMVYTDKQKRWTKAGHLEEQLNSPDSVRRVPWNTLPESVCPFCQQMFTNPEQFRAHQRSHRDKRPN